MQILVRLAPLAALENRVILETRAILEHREILETRVREDIKEELLNLHQVLRFRKVDPRVTKVHRVLEAHRDREVFREHSVIRVLRVQEGTKAKEGFREILDIRASRVYLAFRDIPAPEVIKDPKVT